MSISESPNIVNKPLLTIAIPTYNRSSYLDLCLERIRCELANLSENQRYLVNIFVSDNGSTDSTPEVILKHKNLISTPFENLRNDDNMGMDFNFTRCYQSAKTPYVWLVGDDDIILPNGLKNVLDVLSNCKPDLLYVNNYWFNKSYLNQLHQDRALTITKTKNSLEFTRRINVMLTFLSVLIVRSNVGEEYRSAMEGSNLVQLSWILPLLRDGNSFVVLENKTIAAKGGNSGGYGLVNVFGTQLKKITDSILKGKPEIAKAIQNGTIVKFFPGLIMAFRNGSNSFSDKDMAIGLKEAFGDNWLYYVFIAPIIKLPLYLSRGYYYFVRVLAKLFGSFVI